MTWEITIRETPTLARLGLAIFLARVTGNRIAFAPVYSGVHLYSPHGGGRVYVIRSVEDLERVVGLDSNGLERAMPHLRHAAMYAGDGYYLGVMRQVDLAVAAYKRDSQAA